MHVCEEGGGHCVNGWFSVSVWGMLVCVWGGGWGMEVDTTTCMWIMRLLACRVFLFWRACLVGGMAVSCMCVIGVGEHSLCEWLIQCVWGVCMCWWGMEAGAWEVENATCMWIIRLAYARTVCYSTGGAEYEFANYYFISQKLPSKWLVHCLK